MANKLVLLGAGGHCKSVLDAAIRSRKFNDIVITDPLLPKGTEVMGCSVAGADDMLPELFQAGYTQAFVTVGSIKNWTIRKRLAEMAATIGFTFPVIADPSAQISQYTKIGSGTFIGKSAVVNAEAYIGDHCIINTGAVLEHECLISEFCHVSVGAVLCGGVTLGKGVFVGAGSTIIQMVKVADGAVVGANSTVLKDVASNKTVYGVVSE